MDIDTSDLTRRDE